MLEGVLVQTFSGEIKRDFETFGKKYSLIAEMGIKVSAETGLMIGYNSTITAAGMTATSRTTYNILNVNGEIDESLFAINVVGKEIRHADITDILKDAMNPYDRNVGASNN